MKQNPKITFIFPIFNSGVLALKCLTSIRRLRYPQKRLETIVVDNGSTDAMAKRIRKDFPRVKIIPLSRNSGFAKAVNIAAKRAHGKYLFITNDDVLFEKNSLTRLVNYMERHRKVGAISGTIVATSKRPFRFSTGHKIHHWIGSLTPIYAPRKISSPEWIQGCALMTSTQLFQSLTGFDESFEYFFEDFDYCVRIRKMGLQVVSVPQAMFRHGESVTANRNVADKYYRWYKAKFRFILKHFSPVQLFSILCIQMFMIIPYRSFILHDGRFVPFIKGIVWNIINFHNTWRSR